jgi:hypothetical protein
MSAIASRLRRLETAIGELPVDMLAYKDAWRRYLCGEDNGEAIAALPELPANSSEWKALAVSLLSEFKREGREMRFGKGGPTIRESIARKHGVTK